MTRVIAEPCTNVKDPACVTVCPVDCIHESPNGEMLFIHPAECIDCGACEPECPVEAIFLDSAVPPQWERFIKLNADYAAQRDG